MDGEDGEGSKADDDEEELKHLVVDGGGESTEVGVSQDDGGGDEHAGLKTPAEKLLQQNAERVHGDAGREKRHDGERDGVETAGFLVKTELQVLRYATRLAAEVERIMKTPTKSMAGMAPTQ